MIGILVFSSSFIFWSSIIDAEHLRDNEYIESHNSRWLLRITFFGTIAMFDWKYGIASALLFASSFDQVLNLLMDDSFWHLGTTANWDKFFNRKYFTTPKIGFRGYTLLKSKRINFNFKVLYISVKVICLILSLYLFFFNTEIMK